MLVFKAYFKIIKVNMKQMSIYLIMFLVITISYAMSVTPKGEESYFQAKTNIAYINLGESTTLTEGFKEYLSKYVNFIPIENKQENLQDALFFREVDYIVTIPKNFTKDFLQGNPVEVEKTVVPNSTTRMCVDMAINRYFNIARVYVNNVPGITEENLVKEVAKGNSDDTQVQLKTFGTKKQSNTFSVNYFNYLAYSLFGIVMLGVSSILMVFNNKNLERRNLCSPMKNRNFNFQLILGNLVYALVCYGVLTGFGFMLNKENMMSFYGLLFCINALVFTIAILSISYVVGFLIKNRNAQAAMANILSLGFAFISGVFVPQDLLSNTTLAIASFTPTYWYIKANNAIGSLSSFSFDNLSSILTYMLIELGFALAIFSVALVVSKQKRH